MLPPDLVRRAWTSTTFDSCVRSVLCSALRCALTPDQLVAVEGQVTAAANAVPATPSAIAATMTRGSFLISLAPFFDEARSQDLPKEGGRHRGTARLACRQLPMPGGCGRRTAAPLMGVVCSRRRTRRGHPRSTRRRADPCGGSHGGGGAPRAGVRHARGSRGRDHAGR